MRFVPSLISILAMEQTNTLITFERVIIAKNKKKSKKKLDSLRENSTSEFFLQQQQLTRAKRAQIMMFFH